MKVCNRGANLRASKQKPIGSFNEGPMQPHNLTPPGNGIQGTNVVGGPPLGNNAFGEGGARPTGPAQLPGGNVPFGEGGARPTGPAQLPGGNIPFGENGPRPPGPAEAQINPVGGSGPAQIPMPPVSPDMNAGPLGPLGPMNPAGGPG